MKKHLINQAALKKRKSENIYTHKLKKLNSHIDFDVESKKSNSRKRETRLYCCMCKKKFTLSFKPRNPEVYCDECFKKKNSKRY